MTETPTAWVTELQNLLTRAAELSTKHGLIVPVSTLEKVLHEKSLLKPVAPC